MAAQYSCFIGILVGWVGRLKVFVMGRRKALFGVEILWAGVLWDFFEGGAKGVLAQLDGGGLGGV
jgi:ascorbate-specific PTS system EIIC-type component UlaA